MPHLTPTLRPAARPNRSPLPRGAVLGLVALGAILAVTLAVADEAQATHFRWGILQWEPTGAPNEVKFTGNHGWRTSAFGGAAVGAIVNTGTLDLGDGTSASLDVKVTAVSSVNDWFVGHFVDSAGNEGFTHTYPAPDNNGQPWLAGWESCCRISPHSSGNFHVNNPDQPMRLETTVDLSSPNSSPKTLLPPINSCPINAICTITVPVSDADSDPLSFRLSTSQEAMGGAGFIQPGPPHATNAATIGASSGVITWNTNGATYDSTAQEHTYYSMAIMVEDGTTKVPIDFFVELIPPGVQPPIWTGPTVCGSIRTVRANVPVSFQVQAKSNDTARTVQILGIGLPAGSAFTTDGPANPVTGTFAWTPADEQVGTHIVSFVAEDDKGYQAPACPYTIVVLPGPGGYALSLGLWAGNAVPESAEVQTKGLEFTKVGSGLQRGLVVDQPAHGIYADGFEEQASVTLAGTTSTTFARTEAAHVRLAVAGHTIEVRGLEQRATLGWDIATEQAMLSRQSRVGTVLVDGIETPVAQDAAPVVLALPGGGSVALFERGYVAGATGATYRENLIHVYGTGPYGRSEVIVGSIVLKAGTGQQRAAQERFILPHDDADTGQDAGSTPGTALPIGPGVYHASFPGGDAVDVYRVALTHGTTIDAAFAPAARATVAHNYFVVPPAATPPAVNPPQVGTPAAGTGPLETTTLQLIDPLGNVRVTGSATLGLPARVELNADRNGDWHLVYTRSASSAPGINYTIALGTSPTPLLPQNDALSLGDAPAACDPSGAGIPVIQSGAWVGVVRDADFADTYRFTANIGELVAAALKPGENADGVDMLLELYDRACALLQTSNLNPVGLKGAPETVSLLPVQKTGSYFLRIVRLNGVGNHYLSLTVANPHPTVGMNDALTNSDAPASYAAGPVAPAPVFQGTLHEGDAGDGYRLPFHAAPPQAPPGTGFVVVDMSALSVANVRLYAPGGALLSPLVNTGGLVVYRFTPVTGTYGLEIAPVSGGGNYSVAFAGPPV